MCQKLLCHQKTQNSLLYIVFITLYTQFRPTYFNRYDKPRGGPKTDLRSLMVSRGQCHGSSCLSPACRWGNTVSIPGYFMWDQ
jgi:hypothetical protein